MSLNLKLKSIQKQIQEKKKKYQGKKSISDEFGNSSIIFKIATELAGFAIAGIVLGNFFDKLFASKPFFLIICLLLSSLAFFKTLWDRYIK